MSKLNPGHQEAIDRSVRRWRREHRRRNAPSWFWIILNLVVSVCVFRFSWDNASGYFERLEQAEAAGAVVASLLGLAWNSAAAMLAAWFGIRSLRNASDRLAP